MTAIKELLRDRKLKATPTRVGVLESIQGFNGAIPYSTLQESLGDADRITIFRTLNVLLDNGLIHKTHFENSETYYAMCPATCSAVGHYHNHAHFKCIICDTVTCTHLPEGVRINLPSYKIDKVDIHVTGTCPSCID